MIGLIFVWFFVGLILVAGYTGRSRNGRSCRAARPGRLPVRCHLHRKHLGPHESEWKQDGLTAAIGWGSPYTGQPAVARLEKELSVPLAELIAEAERKAIAIHSPLAWHSPKDAQLIIPVIQNPPMTIEVVGVVGGGASRFPVEVTDQILNSFGIPPPVIGTDGRPIGGQGYTPMLMPASDSTPYSTQLADLSPASPPVPVGHYTIDNASHFSSCHPGQDCQHYVPGMARLEADLFDRSKWLRQELKSIMDTADAYGRAITLDEQRLCERLTAEYYDTDRRLAACRRNITSGPGKPSRQSKPQTGRTPGRS
jgi:hypothetical protein